jgi:hypothetical protein
MPKVETSDVEVLYENLADPGILKPPDQRAGARRGARRVDPRTAAEAHPKGYVPTLPGERDARVASDSNPGRYSNAEFAEKPTAAETPYRSRIFVSGRHSADGLAYGVGDPIREPEARRQAIEVFGEVFTPITPTVEVVAAASMGAVTTSSSEGNVFVETSTGEPISTVTPEDLPPELVPEPLTEDPTTKCPRCEGYGKSPKMVRRHGPEVGHCAICKPCPDCGGTGYLVPEEVTTDGSDQPEAE